MYLTRISFLLISLAHDDGNLWGIIVKTKKLENLDEQALNDLALELEGDATTTTEAEETANKKIAKKKATIQRKQEIDAKRKKQTGDADDDGDVAAVGKKKN